MGKVGRVVSKKEKKEKEMGINKGREKGVKCTGIRNAADPGPSPASDSHTQHRVHILPGSDETQKGHGRSGSASGMGGVDRPGPPGTQKTTQSHVYHVTYLPP